MRLPFLAARILAHPASRRPVPRSFLRSLPPTSHYLPAPAPRLLRALPLDPHSPYLLSRHPRPRRPFRSRSYASEHVRRRRSFVQDVRATIGWDAGEEQDSWSVVVNLQCLVSFRSLPRTTRPPYSRHLYPPFIHTLV